MWETSTRRVWCSRPRARWLFKVRKKGGWQRVGWQRRPQATLAGTETWGQTEQLRPGRLTLLEQTCTDETRCVTGAGGPGPPHGVVSCPCPGLPPKALKLGWRLRRGGPQPRTGKAGPVQTGSPLQLSILSVRHFLFLHHSMAGPGVHLCLEQRGLMRIQSGAAAPADRPPPQPGSHSPRAHHKTVCEQ